MLNQITLDDKIESQIAIWLWMRHKNKHLQLFNLQSICYFEKWKTIHETLLMPDNSLNRCTDCLPKKTKSFSIRAA